jgi:nicotinate-nucleotide pyrophosphorylase (carboxylating)
VIAAALSEDLAEAGDITSAAIFGADHSSTARVVARDAGRISGINVAGEVFSQLDPRCEIEILLPDSADATAGETIANIFGSTRALLTGERTALNLLGHLSGIATATAEMVAAVGGTDAVIADTRKTTPGLRALEKYAVRCGGGANHRMGLYDAAMIKDNHIAAAGSIEDAVRLVGLRLGHMVKISVEVDRIDQIEDALAAGADVILLDNMAPDQLAAAIGAIGGRAITEASGGVSLETVRAIAESGVDVISVGSITHSAPSLDVALDF